MAITLTTPAACGDGDSPAEPDPSAATGQPTPTSTPGPPAADTRLFEFEITDSEATPPLERAQVPLDATVRIVVTSDQPDEVHLHGYDLTAQAAPGQPAVIEFVADQTGLFELETHDSGLVLLQLQVQ